MAKKYDNDFKVMIVELLKSRRSVKKVSDEYDLNDSMIRRWRREYEAKSGAFTKKRELSQEEKGNDPVLLNPVVARSIKI